MLERELSAWLARRHPQHFVPRYSMVTFRRLPYVLAYERGKIQADMLKSAVAGCDSFAQIDLEAVEHQVLAQLPVLPSA